MTEMTLYNLIPEFKEILAKEELTDEDSLKISELGHAIEIKASNICSLTDQMESFVAFCKLEESRISAKRKAVQNKIKWLNNYLKTNMESAGIGVIEFGTKKVSLQKNPPKLFVDDEDIIPPKYFIVIPESFQLDRKRLLKDLKAGDIAGVHSEQSLSLRKR